MTMKDILDIEASGIKFSSPSWALDGFSDESYALSRAIGAAIEVLASLMRKELESLESK